MIARAHGVSLLGSRLCTLTWHTTRIMGAYRSIAAGTLRAREWSTRAAAPSLDDPRFESLLLRLHASIDIHEFWSALLSMLDEFVPHDACVAYLDYVDFTRTCDASRILATPNARRSREWLERRREVNMMPAFALSHPGLKLYRLSQVVPDRAPAARIGVFPAVHGGGGLVLLGVLAVLGRGPARIRDRDPAYGGAGRFHRARDGAAATAASSSGNNIATFVSRRAARGLRRRIAAAGRR